MAIADSASPMRWLVGSRSEPAPTPPAPSASLASIWKVPVRSFSHGYSVDPNRPHESVDLVPGVLACRLAQLEDERLLHLGEALVVARAEPDREVVGDDDATADVDGAAGVHLPRETTADLDGTQTAAEHAGEGPLHHVLETALETPQSHPENIGATVPRSPGRRRHERSGGPSSPASQPSGAGEVSEANDDDALPGRAWTAIDRRRIALAGRGQRGCSSACSSSRPSAGRVTTPGRDGPATGRPATGPATTCPATCSPSTRRPR